MMAYSFSTAMLAGMACDGFVTVVVDSVRAGDRTIKVRRLRITHATTKVPDLVENSVPARPVHVQQGKTRLLGHPCC
jgi:hypothetical protein